MKTLIAACLLYFISHLISAQNKSVGSEKILSRMKTEKSSIVRMNLILQLAHFTSAQLPVWERDSIISTLVNWYRTDPDPGVHSAIDYLFRPAKRGEELRKVDWGMSQKLEQIDSAYIGVSAENRNWYLTVEGQTMAIIKRPSVFIMGSPLTEPERDEDEMRHQVRIPRSFAMSTKEITVAQFQKFLEANPDIKARARADSAKDPSRMNKKLLMFSPQEECPQILITWYEAAQYCNWLSKEEGILEAQWCYPPLDQIKSGMQLPSNYLERTGYRLPTEAEWEFACRAGSHLSRFYGASNQLLSSYAWYSKHPPMRKGDVADPQDPQHTYPVGELKPNPLGLFDIYGNVWEWCQSKRVVYLRDEITEDNEDTTLIITDSIPMVRRGGSFSYGKEVMRSAHRGDTNYFPMQRRDNVGFRIARSLPNTSIPFNTTSADSLTEQLVKIGFHSLFLSSTGQQDAKVTVVFESGAGGSSKDWTQVRSLLPASVRSLAYDRAGLGKSEAGPLPRTMAQEVLELHYLLERAYIKGPIILVGQSIGGLLVRLYTEQYGKNVVGLVLVDPTHESSVLGSIKYGGWVRLREKALRKVVPEPQLTNQISAGYDSTADYMAEEFQQIYLSGIKNPQSLKNRPLVVIVAGKRNQPPGTPDDQWKALKAERNQQIQDLTSLSANSKFILAPDSGHLIHYDNPQIVAKSIQMVIKSIETKTKL